MENVDFLAPPVTGLTDSRDSKQCSLRRRRQKRETEFPRYLYVKRNRLSTIRVCR